MRKKRWLILLHTGRRDFLPLQYFLLFQFLLRKRKKNKTKQNKNKQTKKKKKTLSTGVRDLRKMIGKTEGWAESDKTKDKKNHCEEEKQSS